MVVAGIVVVNSVVVNIVVVIIVVVTPGTVVEVDVDVDVEVEVEVVDPPQQHVVVELHPLLGFHTGATEVQPKGHVE